jgi:hypothetical protein
LLSEIWIGDQGSEIRNPGKKNLSRIRIQGSKSRQILDPDPGFRIRIDLNADWDTDPDPAFFLIADPDYGSGSGSRV